MGFNYAEQRIRDALKQSKGNLAKAQKLIIAWCADDHKLLHALSKPHMSGIAAYAIGRVATKPLVSQKNHPPAEPEVAEDKFGREMLKSFASDNPIKFNEESFSAPLKKTAASQRHIDTINKLARKIKPT